jgi:tetratricopeptide (TPR) repeat protein
MRDRKSRFAGLETAGGNRSGRRPGAAARDSGYYLREALDLELAGRHERALNKYSAALGEDPLCITAWAGQLWMLLYLEDPAEAEIWSDKALQSFPNDPDVLALKSLAQWRCGFETSARNLNDAALSAARDSANVWLARGEIQIGGDMKSASACFVRAVAAPGQKGVCHLRAGDILVRSGKFAAAIEYHRKATRILPGSSWAWYGYGRAQREVGNERYALAAFDRALDLSPRDPRYKGARLGAVGWRRRFANWAMGFWK